MLNLSFRRLRARFALLAVVALSALLLRSAAFARTSVFLDDGQGSGEIQGNAPRGDKRASALPHLIGASDA
jgi:hypothetical protein